MGVEPTKNSFADCRLTAHPSRENGTSDKIRTCTTLRPKRSDFTNLPTDASRIIRLLLPQQLVRHQVQLEHRLYDYCAP